MLAAALLWASFASASVLDLQYTLPPTARSINGDVAGFSIEYDRFSDWAGNVSARNEFTYALLDNLKKRTGCAPHIRVGGGSQDLQIYTPSVEYYLNNYAPVPNASALTSTKQLFPQGNYNRIGDKFFLSAGNFPAGTKFDWGANFYVGNVSEVVVEARAIIKAFGDPRLAHVSLESIAIGNEVDGLSAGGRRPKNYTVWDYVTEFSGYAKAVNEQVNKDVKFRLGDFEGIWNAVQLFSTGFTSQWIGQHTVSVSEHHYQNGDGDFSIRPPSDWPQFAADLVTKDFVRGNLSRYTVSAQGAHSAGYKYYLGETNSFYGHGQPGVSNAAAAALWMIDYVLHAATIGVDGLHLHQGVGYNYSAFIPIDRVGPNIETANASAVRHVLPLYYGYVAVADAVGRSGEAKINEMYTDNNTLSAYSIWEGGELKRVMIINSQRWSALSEGGRPIRNVKMPALEGKECWAKRLYLPNLDALNGTTWANQTWTSSGQAAGTEAIEKIKDDGSIDLEASSAALIYL